MRIGRHGFTLIELLVIIAIMATMVTVGVVNFGASRGATRVFGAGRDVMAMVRRARSLALVTQKPVIITYSNETIDGEALAKVEIQGARIFNAKKGRETVYNLDGEIVSEAEADDGDAQGGETIEDVLAPEAIPEDVLKGLRVKVLDESEQLNLPENETRRSKISIFSTADNVSRTFETVTPAVSETAIAENASPTETDDEPFKAAFAANGTVSPPHRIWVYQDGASPEEGICIHVDRFGEPKCEDFQ